MALVPEKLSSAHFDNMVQVKGVRATFSLLAYPKNLQLSK